MHRALPSVTPSARSICTRRALTWRRRLLSSPVTAHAKSLWIETSSKDVLTAALEAGANTFVFRESAAALAESFGVLGKFRTLFIRQDGQLTDGSSEVGRVVAVGSPEDLRQAEAYADLDGSFVMDASDWTIIPAENLVAAFQGKRGTLLGVATSAGDARILLEALEVGTDGVVLRTDDAREVRAAAEYLRRLAVRYEERLELIAADVTRIEAVGMGDRVAVDLCSLLVPGEGLLVGSFSRGLFLVHSECAESHYINSRPFRVNCGPVHAYALMPDGKTCYLSELKAGAEALVVSDAGRQRTAVVGRVKIETRPLVLVEAEAGGETFSALLQNAETVRLVAPEGPGGGGGGGVAVTDLAVGDRVLLHRLEAARHAGMAISEQIVER